MHNTRRNSSLAAAVVVSLVAPLSAAQAAETDSAYAPLASQNQAGFGKPIAFVAAAYTPPGIFGTVRGPLASQDLPGFGEPIAFVAAAYTPPGIVGIVRGPLASLDQPGFGEPIVFVASSYTPPGIVGVLPIEVVEAR